MRSPPCSPFIHVTWLKICWREGHIPLKKNVILSRTCPVLLTLRVTMRTDVKHWRSCLLSIAFEKSNMICGLSSLLCMCWKLSLPADPVASSKVSVCSAICCLGTTATLRLTCARVGGFTYRLPVWSLRHYPYKMNSNFGKILSIVDLERMTCLTPDSTQYIYILQTVEALV